jgi:hypothetical protein
MCSRDLSVAPPHRATRVSPATRCRGIDEDSLPTIYLAFTFQSAARDQLRSRARNEKYLRRNALSSFCVPRSTG